MTWPLCGFHSQDILSIFWNGEFQSQYTASSSSPGHQCCNYTGGVGTLTETVKPHVVVTLCWIQICSQREDLNKLEGQKVINSKWIDLSYWPYIVQVISLSRDCCIKVYRCNYFSSQSYRILNIK